MYSPDYGLVIKVQKHMGGDNVHETANLLQAVIGWQYAWKQLGHGVENQAERTKISGHLEAAEKQLRAHFWSKIRKAG